MTQRKLKRREFLQTAAVVAAGALVAQAAPAAGAEEQNEKEITDILIVAKFNAAAYAAFTDRELEAAEGQLRLLLGSSGNQPQPLAPEINWVYLGTPVAVDNGWMAIIGGEDSYQKFAAYFKEETPLHRLYNLEVYSLYRRYTSDMANGQLLAPIRILTPRSNSSSW